MEVLFIVRIVGVCVTSLLLFALLRISINRVTQPLSSRMADSLLNVLRFFLFYTLYFLVVAATLNFAGFNVTALLGAAGVFGVAIGFASQTTIANIISGIFLMVEQSLRVGDLIAYEGIHGRIKELGLLSMTLRTTDNKLIRVPNERLIKANVVNLTALKERRLTFQISAYKTEDASKIKDLIKAAWGNSSQTLKDKPVNISYIAISGEMLGFTADIWVKTAEVTSAKSAYIEECYKEAKKQKINCYVSWQDR